jgi:hypothetical protein
MHLFKILSFTLFSFLFLRLHFFFLIRPLILLKSYFTPCLYFFFSICTFLSHLISSHLISSLLYSSHPISSLLFSSHLISSLLISSDLISSHLFSTHLISSLLISSDLISSLLYSSHPISSLLYSSHLFSTLLYSSLLYSTLLYSTLLYSTLLYSLSFLLGWRKLRSITTRPYKRLEREETAPFILDTLSCSQVHTRSISFRPTPSSTLPYIPSILSSLSYNLYHRFPFFSNLTYHLSDFLSLSLIFFSHLHFSPPSSLLSFPPIFFSILSIQSISPPFYTILLYSLFFPTLLLSSPFLTFLHYSPPFSSPLFRTRMHHRHGHRKQSSHRLSLLRVPRHPPDALSGDPPLCVGR